MKHKIKLQLGRNNSPPVADISLRFEGDNEAEQLLAVIEAIETINIEPDHVDLENINTLITRLQTLLAFKCIKHQQEYIITIAREYFKELIKHMLSHVSGESGSERRRYYHNLRKTIAITNLVNEAWSANNNTALGLNIPAPYAPDALKEIARGKLPQTLNAFLQSIRTAPGASNNCLNWIDIFNSKVSKNRLRAYFQQITMEIQQKTNDKEVFYISQQIQYFVNALRPCLKQLRNQDNCQFVEQLFVDAAKHGDRSPLRLPEEKHVPQLQEKIQISKKSVENKLEILTARRQLHFEQNFADFRQLLSTHLELPKVEPGQFLVSLNERMPKNRSNNSMDMQSLRKYLNRCITRVSHPLPEDLNSRMNNLMILYSYRYNQPYSPRKQNKYLFLLALKDNIKIHPEKTYQECFDLTKENVSADIQSLVTESRSLRLFGTHHQFKDFLSDLLQFEPDYSSDLNHSRSIFNLFRR